MKQKSLVWIAKLYRGQVTQYHPQQARQNDDIIAKVLAGNRVAPVGLAHTWPPDENTFWFDVSMHKSMCMEVRRSIQKTNHHMPALHLYQTPLL